MNDIKRYNNPKEIKFLKKSIEIYKNRLIAKVKKSGIYENFGQNEVRQLKDSFSGCSDYSDMLDIIQVFDNWCGWYNG
jgi:hypothetical protein